MNWVHFVETKQPITTSEQNRLVDDWYNSRPVMPGASKLRYKNWKLRAIHRANLEQAMLEYERAMSAWRLEVRQFFKMWPTNEYVSAVLRKSAKDTHVL